jgi:hypothetical protein
VCDVTPELLLALIPGLPFGPQPCNPFALVMSPKLELRHFPSTLQHFGGGKFAFFIAKILSNLPIPLISTTTTIVPLWNCYIDNYVYGIFGFVNK